MENDRPPESDALARVLSASRPEPGAPFVHALETRLGLASGARAERSRRWRRGPALVAGGLAAIVLVFSLLGVGPLSQSGKQAAKAQDTCRYVFETRLVPVPEVSIVAGRTVIKVRHRYQRQLVRRCR